VLTTALVALVYAIFTLIGALGAVVFFGFIQRNL